MNRTEWEARLTSPVDEARDHVQGSASAPVTLVEYGDYECPYCGQAYPILKDVQARMGEGLGSCSGTSPSPRRIRTPSARRRRRRRPPHRGGSGDA